MPAVIAVGTTHPYVSAGVLLDLQTLHAFDVRPLAVIAGVSAQTAGAVTARRPLDAATIDAQFDALCGAPVDAICIGALLDPLSAGTVARRVRERRVPVVYDPVIAASNGDLLADEATLAAIRSELIGACTLIVPNLAEAAALSCRPIASRADVHAALPALLGLGAAAVLITGGHLAGDPCDVFADSDGIREWQAPRIEGQLRGTGSLLTAAIAARLAYGDTLPSAIGTARDFVRARIRDGVSFAGMRVAR